VVCVFCISRVKLLLEMTEKYLATSDLMMFNSKKSNSCEVGNSLFCVYFVFLYYQLKKRETRAPEAVTCTQ